VGLMEVLQSFSSLPLTGFFRCILTNKLLGQTIVGLATPPPPIGLTNVRP